MQFREILYLNNTKWIYRKIVQASLAVILCAYALGVWFNHQAQVDKILLIEQYQVAHNYNALLKQQLLTAQQAKASDTTHASTQEILANAFKLPFVLYIKLADAKGVANIMLDDENLTEYVSPYTVVSEIYEQDKLTGYLTITYDVQMMQSNNAAIKQKTSNDFRLIIFLVGLGGLLMSRAFFNSNKPVLSQ